MFSSCTGFVSVFPPHSLLSVRSFDGSLLRRQSRCCISSSGFLFMGSLFSIQQTLRLYPVSVVQGSLIISFVLTGNVCTLFLTAISSTGQRMFGFCSSKKNWDSRAIFFESWFIFSCSSELLSVADSVRQIKFEPPHVRSIQCALTLLYRYTHSYFTLLLSVCVFFCSLPLNRGQSCFGIHYPFDQRSNLIRNNDTVLGCGSRKKTGFWREPKIYP